MAALNATPILDGGDSINRGLKVWYPFAETGGVIAKDISQNGYDARPTGAGAFTRRTGPLGAFASWDGTSVGFKPAKFSWPNASPISVSVWVNSSAARGGAGFTITGGARTIRLWLPYFDGVIYWEGGDGGSGGISTSFSAYADKWTHVVVVNNNVDFKAIYINGNLITSSTAALTSMDGGSSLMLGEWEASGYSWLGQMSNFRIASRVFTPGEVRRLYREPWAGTLQGNLRARRTFDVSSGGPITGSAAVTLGALTSAGTGTLSIAGTGARTLGALTTAGTGTLGIQGTAARTLAALTSAGTGTLTIAGTAGVTLGALTSTGTGELPITGTAAATLEDLTSASVEPAATTTHGRLRRVRRTIIWDDPPPELAPVVSLAENYAEDRGVEAAVDAAIAKLERLSNRATILRRAKVLEEVRVSIVEAVARAAEQDDEEALIALL